MSPGGSHGKGDRPRRLGCVSQGDLFHNTVLELTVVALLALGAVTAHVTETAA